MLDRMTLVRPEDLDSDALEEDGWSGDDEEVVRALVSASGSGTGGFGLALALFIVAFAFVFTFAFIPMKVPDPDPLPGMVNVPVVPTVVMDPTLICRPGAGPPPSLLIFNI